MKLKYMYKNGMDKSGEDWKHFIQNKLYVWYYINDIQIFN